MTQTRAILILPFQLVADLLRQHEPLLCRQTAFLKRHKMRCVDRGTGYLTLRHAWNSHRLCKRPPTANLPCLENNGAVAYSQTSPNESIVQPFGSKSSSGQEQCLPPQMNQMAAVMHLSGTPEQKREALLGPSYLSCEQCLKQGRKASAGDKEENRADQNHGQDQPYCAHEAASPLPGGEQHDEHHDGDDGGKQGSEIPPPLYEALSSKLSTSLAPFGEIPPPQTKRRESGIGAEQSEQSPNQENCCREAANNHAKKEPDQFEDCIARPAREQKEQSQTSHKRSNSESQQHSSTSHEQTETSR